MPAESDCVFCKIVAGKIPAAVILDDADCLAFLDIGPLAEGHVLLIPKRHCARLADMPAETCAALAHRIPRIAAAVTGTMGVGGFNMLINDGGVAGQVVPHVHAHFVPRKSNDGLGYRWNAGKYPEGRLQELQQAYAAALKAK